MAVKAKEAAEKKKEYDQCPETGKDGKPFSADCPSDDFDRLYVTGIANENIPEGSIHLVVHRGRRFAHCGCGA